MGNNLEDVLHFSLKKWGLVTQPPEVYNSTLATSFPSRSRIFTSSGKPELSVVADAPPKAAPPVTMRPGISEDDGVLVDCSSIATASRQPIFVWLEIFLPLRTRYSTVSCRRQRMPQIWQRMTVSA